MSPPDVTTPLHFVRVYQQLMGFRAALTQHRQARCPEDVDPILWRAQRESLESLVDQWTEALDKAAGVLG